MTPPARSERVTDLLDRMTLAEKVGQMTQAELGSVTPDDVARCSLGSVLSGGGGNPGDGTAAAWRESVEGFIDGSRRSRLGIPILYGSDAVHGHNNVVDATIFPHHIGLGAAGDPELVRRVSRAAAIETAATAVRWSFAPCLAVPLDVRWGRTYEGFGQDPRLVGALGRAAVDGWHGDALDRDGVLACAKHFVGEGAMVWGSAGAHRQPWIDWWDGWGPGWQIDQGDIEIDESELRRTHLPPFVDALDAGALTVMACYASWHGQRMHGHRQMLTDVLKRELGFSGFVVSDWMAVDQLHDDHATAAELAIDAGVDMVMVPFEYERFIETVVGLVESDRLTMSRIDDAVGRILHVKERAGLLDDRPVEHPPLDTVGCVEHRVLARRAAAATSVTLFDRGVLPIPADVDVLAAGEAVDDIGLACGGWTISWEGSAGAITSGRTILGGLRDGLGGERVRHVPDGAFGTAPDEIRAPLGVVTVHEPPYVEGGGDRSDLSIPEEQLDIVRSLRERVDQLIVVIVSGRPLFVEPLLDVADAIVAAWLPGSEAAGIADVLLGRWPSAGRLPVAWPRSSAAESADFTNHPPRWPVGHRAEPTAALPLAGGR